MLVWSGQFQSVADIPEFVHEGKIQKARYWLSRRLWIWSIVGLMIGFFFEAKHDKRNSREGRNLNGPVPIPEE